LFLGIEKERIMKVTVLGDWMSRDEFMALIEKLQNGETTVAEQAAKALEKGNPIIVKDKK